MVTLAREWLQRPAERVVEVARAPLVAVRSTGTQIQDVVAPAPAEREAHVIERRPVHARSGPAPRWWKVGLATGALAFVAAVAVLTLPELVGGRSIVGDDRTTLFKGAADPEPAPTAAPAGSGDEREEPDAEDPAVTPTPSATVTATPTPTATATPSPAPTASPAP